MTSSDNSQASGQKTLLAWWFAPRIRSIITIPIFLLLVVCCILVFFNGGIQTLAYFRILKAVFGLWGIVIFVFLWPFSLLLPGLLWWKIIKEIPRFMQDETRKRSSAVGYFIISLLFFVGVSTSIQWVHGKAIGWIVDRNPDAAFRAGVTGSKTPSESTESPELSCHFKGADLRYVGNFFGNHVYIEPAGDFKLADNKYAVEVYTAREDYAVIFRNPENGNFALFDPSTNAKVPDDLIFKPVEPNTLLAKAWSIASGKTTSDRIENGKSNRKWAYVDSSAGEEQIEYLFVIPRVEVDPENSMEFAAFLALNQQKAMMYIDPANNKFAPVRSDVFWTPLEDIKYRDMRQDGVETAILKLIEKK